MRLLLCISDLTKGRGGAERVAAEMAGEMAERGHDVAIYSDAAPEEESAYPLNPKITHIKGRLKQGKNYDEVREALAAYKPDIGFIFYYNAKFILQHALISSLNIPVGLQECTNPVRAVNNLVKDKSIDDLYSAFTIRKAFMTATHGIRLTMDSYAKFTPHAAQDHVFTYKNPFPIDDSPRPFDLSQSGSSLAPGMIINVGGLKGPNKNGAVLARAFAELSEEFPNWTLKFFGKSNFDEVDQIIADYDLKDRLIVAGTVNNIHDEYRAADIHVICSFAEGCPNVVCEAMGHGVPSIGFSDCRGTNELIVPGKNGMLLARDPEVDNLKSALREMMLHPELRQAYGKTAHDEAKILFPATKVYDRWEELFSHMMEYRDAPERLTQDHAKANFEEYTHHAAIRARTIDKYLKVNVPGHESHDELSPLVSVIVPLFNKEDHIEGTLGSILSSTYKRIEIIIVDDCSTDRSIEIITPYLSDPRIQLVPHKTNQGLSAARNTGLTHVKGDYIQFWDADDKFNADWLSEIIPMMEADFSDIGTGVAYRDGKILPWYQPGAMLCRNVTFEICPDVFSASSTCFKIYRHAFLKRHDINFVHGLYMQDTEFNLRAMPLARSMTMTPFPVGEYLATDNSASSIVSPKRMDSCFKINQLTLDYYNANNLKHLNGFRGDKVIRFVFNFFVARLINVTTDNSEKNRAALGPDFDPDTIAKYLQKFREHVRLMPESLIFMSEAHGRRALAYLAFAIGRETSFRDLIRGSAIEPSLLQGFYDNDIGISHSDISRMIKQANYAVPETARVKQPA